MTLVHRVLHPHPVESLDEYVKIGGGRGLEIARDMDPDLVIEVVRASGLRGRGGAGFPTGVKWRTVRDNRSADLMSTVVVNGAEGEPGTFKDRTIWRINPYQVIEGALIGAHAVDASDVIVAVKRSFSTERARVAAALDELRDAGWFGDVKVDLFAGPDEYLYGEETALLETIDGRYPFPRIAPPFRRGVNEIVRSDADATSGSGLSAHVLMAGPDSDEVAPPALVDNVETLANIGKILARGADWFRTEGTEASPGTMVCTVTGSVQRAGVAEVLMGTPLRELIETVGGGARRGRRITAVLPGVSSGFLPAAALDTPICYEALAAAGSGLGSGGFIVFDDSDDLVAVGAGVARFLAVESCGQCTPCKLDGLTIADALERLARSDAGPHDLAQLRHAVSTVGDRARCALAGQQQAVIGSLLERFGDTIDGHLHRRIEGRRPHLIAELVDIDDEGIAVWDERHRDKQPDWSYDERWAGQLPADLFDEHRAPKPLEEP